MPRLRLLTLLAMCWGFALQSCAVTEEGHRQAQRMQDLADTTVWDNRSDVNLRIKDNHKVSLVVKLDSILCEHVTGAEGVVYFDEPLWNNLTLDTKKRLTECLDLKRHLQVRAWDASQPTTKMWTARLSQNHDRLLIGTVQSNCISCELTEGQFEYTLERVDSVYIPKRIGENEMWR